MVTIESDIQFRVVKLKHTCPDGKYSFQGTWEATRRALCGVQPYPMDVQESFVSGAVKRYRKLLRR